MAKRSIKTKTMKYEPLSIKTISVSQPQGLQGLKVYKDYELDGYNDQLVRLKTTQD
ncbi:unnamed protein product [Brassica oleracea]